MSQNIAGKHFDRVFTFDKVLSSKVLGFYFSILFVPSIRQERELGTLDASFSYLFEHFFDLAWGWCKS